MCKFYVSTPPGKGAIAVLTLIASNPAALISTFFVPKSRKALSSYAPGAVVYGQAAEEDVLVCPISPQEMEIHCHGSLAAVGRFKEFLRNLGAEEIEFPRLSLSEKPLTENQRCAFDALLNSETSKIAAILWDQYDGAYEKALQNGENTEKWDDFAVHLTEPWKVVMVGRPNVGKSSLFNRILGFSRAIVFEEAGTTRDIVQEKTVLDGWRIELTDTAGLHEANDEVEQEGIRRAHEAIRAADLILWVRDASQTAEERNSEEKNLIFPPQTRILTVWNKVDLLKNPELWEKSLRNDEIEVSAQQEIGMEALIQKIVHILVPVEPSAGTGMKVLWRGKKE